MNKCGVRRSRHSDSLASFLPVRPQLRLARSRCHQHAGHQAPSLHRFREAPACPSCGFGFSSQLTNGLVPDCNPNLRVEESEARIMRTLFRSPLVLWTVLAVTREFRLSKGKRSTERQTGANSDRERDERKEER